MPLPPGFQLDQPSPPPLDVKWDAQASGSSPLNIKWDRPAQSGSTPLAVTWDKPSVPAPAQPTGDTGVLSYLKNTFQKIAQNLNVENTLSQVDEQHDPSEFLHEGLKNAVLSAINPAAPFLQPILKDVHSKLQSGDYSGATATLAPVVAAFDGVSGGSDALANSAADTAGNTINAATGVVSDFAKSPVGQAITKNAVKTVAKKVVAGTAGAAGLHGGPLGGLAAYAATDWIMGKLFPNEAAETAADAVTTAQPVKPVSTQISMEPEISPKISVRSASNADGTTSNGPITITTNAGKSFRTVDTLTPDTQAALAQAARSGKLTGLPAEQKTALVQAVKSGDNDAVQSVLGIKHSALDNLATAIQNKLAVLTHYAQSNDVDVSAIAPEDRTAFADAAHAHGVQNGLPVPAKGYRGISDSTWKLLTDALSPK